MEHDTGYVVVVTAAGVNFPGLPHNIRVTSNDNNGLVSAYIYTGNKGGRTYSNLRFLTITTSNTFLIIYQRVIFTNLIQGYMLMTII